MHPAHDGRRVHFQAALQHHLPKIAIADAVLAVPANTHQNILDRETTALEHKSSYRRVLPWGLADKVNATEPFSRALVERTVAELPRSIPRSLLPVVY